VLKERFLTFEPMTTNKTKTISQVRKKKLINFFFLHFEMQVLTERYNVKDDRDELNRKYSSNNKLHQVLPLQNFINYH
jgi:hypothetical protein